MVSRSRFTVINIQSFQGESKQDKKDTKITQFGRVLSTLNIDIIFANSPQAKGRVERANQNASGPSDQRNAPGRHLFD